MKKTFFVLLSIISTEIFAQTYNVSGQNLSSGTYTVYCGNIVAPKTSSPGDSYSGTSTVSLIGAQYVSLLPGFQAGGYSNSGYFLGYISTNSPIADIEVPSTGNQYEKFEIDLNLKNYYIC